MRRNVAAGVLAGCALSAAACAGSPASPSTSESPAAEAVPADLPESTTFTTIKGLPADLAASKVPDGTVVSPKSATVIYDAPDGEPRAILPASQLNSPTWVPVVETVPGWHRVMLPSRPNRSTGWIRTDGIEAARSEYAIRVALKARKLTIYKSGRARGSWRVAVGAPGTPTPVGRTFLLASLATGKAQKGSKTTPAGAVLPVGAHSATLDTFGGGPGTVAFHGWPDAKVFGRAASHGCVRVPPAALKALSSVPLGSPVLITA
ncbi:L,D-transpeptidase [Actinocorallia longicatena]|uniref:L,D-TPase catalytic domain-containing protein n=1 Tax=Actinocorallia longicatena TaxID=111803 RepID=A0ABP6QG12_9ACTN